MYIRQPPWGENRKQLIANAAHELRTPLTALNLQVEAVARSTDNNPVDNSIRYPPARGIVKIEISTIGEKCILEIIESGAGIPAADRDRVFDRFFRGLGHRTNGSGLGLAVGHKFITY